MSNADTRRSLAARLATLNSDALSLRLVLALLADENGVVETSKNELQSLLGVSRTTLQKRLKLVDVEVSGDIVKLSIPYEPTLAAILDRVIESNVSIVSMESQYTGRDVINRWSDAYRTMYNEPYSYGAFYIAKNQANAFVKRYGAMSLDIVGFVFENYEVLWASPRFPRPTYGALMSWLGEQASEYVKKRRATRTAPATIARVSDDGVEPLF